MHDLFFLIGILLCVPTLPLVLELFLINAAALAFRSEGNLPPSGLRLTIVIAAHNEEKLIGRTIASIQAADTTGNHRIHVIAHNCTDATTQIVRAAGAEVTELNGPTGKGHALLHAFTHLREASMAFLILDADTIVEQDLTTRVAAALGQYDAVQCRYEAIPHPDTQAQLAALAFRAMNVVRPRGRERLSLSCGIFGNGFAFRASVLDCVPYNAHSIVEDLEFHIALVSAGIRVHYLDRARLYGEIQGTRSQHARWEGGRLQIALQKLPGMLSLLLRGQLRLFEPMLDLASLPQALAILLLVISLLLPDFWVRAYAACALLTIAAHIAEATALAASPSATLRILLLAPIYIARKFVGTKAALRSAQNQAHWQRAERDTTGDSKS